MPVVGPSTLNGMTCEPWANAGDVCGCDDVDALMLEESLQIASDILYDLTRRRWPGQCETTVRPCRRDGGCFGHRASYGAAWYRHGGPPVESCGCGGQSEWKFPHQPVITIGEVLVDGVVVDPADYQLQDGRLLVAMERDDGSRQRWPTCQRLDRPATEDGTWQVTYTHGARPPAGGVRAAASLGCQLSLACSSDSSAQGKCRLPKRVTSITRQGVSLAVLDPLTLFADGLTGLAEVDMWVQAVNRGSAQRGAAVLDPLRAPRVRRTPA